MIEFFVNLDHETVWHEPTRVDGTEVVRPVKHGTYHCACRSYERTGRMSAGADSGGYEELQSTNEELETTNEELQSTVEELETTNEELQSTNEELETMNEELQSTNDELQAINDELRDRTGDLNQAKQFLETILTGLRAGVAVLDAEMRVLVWTRHAEDLWGLRQEETVGQHFLNLDIGLPTQELRPLIRRTLAGEIGPHETVFSAVNRRGRPILVRVAGSSLDSTDGKANGAILLMEQDVTPDRTGSESPGQHDGQPPTSMIDADPPTTTG